MDSKHIRAHLNLGIVYGRQWNIRRRSLSTRKLSVSIQSYRGLFQYGRFLRSEGGVERVHPSLQKGLSINPDYIEARTNLEMSIFDRKSWTRHLRNTSRTVEINPRYAHAITILETSTG